MGTPLHDHFNSIKVRLKLLPPDFFALVFLNFNSIKVRLKHSAGMGQGQGNSFQFHKGTIKTFGIK